MKKSKLGYKKNSPDKKEPSLKIDSNFITMEGVDFPVEAYPNGDSPIVMQPGLNYYFPNSTEVVEVPLKRLKKQTGGTVKPNIQKLGDIEFDSNTAKPHPEGYLIVKDNKTGKDFGVVRNSDGSYRHAGMGIKDFFDKHGNRVSEEYKSSLAGSLFMAPVDYLTSLPQAVSTYVSSGGKEVLPSRAVKIQNPIGAAVTDAILDPLNLVGVGELKAAINSRRVANRVNFLTKEFTDIHDIRHAYHNNSKFLTHAEQKLLKKKGKGNPKNYKNIGGDDILGKSLEKNIPEEPFKQPSSRKELEESLFGKEQKKIPEHSPITEEPINLTRPNKSTLEETTDYSNRNNNINPEKNIFQFSLTPSYQRTTVSKRGDEWLENWYQNDQIKQRFIDYGGSTKNWEKVQNSLQNPVRSGYVYGENQPSGLYSTMLDRASVDKGMSLEQQFGAAVHEGAHKTKIVLGENNTSLPKLYNDLTDAVRLDPAETYAEIARMRAKNGWKPGKKVTSKQLEIALKDNTHYDIGSKTKDKGILLDIINKAPAITPFIYEATQTNEKKYQKGGPTNGDKPVLMQPGLNYYFPNSTEVIEIPMRKLKKQTGGTVKPNIQKLGDIEFDSNTARQFDGYLIVKDNKTGKDFGVYRNSNGSYSWYTGVPTFENKFLKDNQNERIPPLFYNAAENSGYITLENLKFTDKTLNDLTRFSKNRVNGRMTKEEVDYRRKIAESVTPFGYNVNKVAEDVKTGAIPDSMSYVRKPYLNFYLGLPESDTSFVKSKYQPSIKGEKKPYYVPKEGFDKNEVFLSYMDAYELGESGSNVSSGVRNISSSTLNPLGTFTLGRGRDDSKGDYISVYDEWDLDPLKGNLLPSLGAAAAKKLIPNINNLNNPFSVYDRIYLSDLSEEQRAAILRQDKALNVKVKHTTNAYSNGGIHIDPSKRGTFKAQATRMGMSVKEAADHILANKDKYTPKMIKKANFAKNFAQDGMLVPNIPESTAMVLPVRDISVDDMLEMSLNGKTKQERAMIEDLSSRTRVNKMFEEAGDWQPKKKMSKPKKFYEKEEGGYYEEGGPTNGQTRRSTRKGKKIDVYMDGSWHAFGDSSMQDFRQHKSEKRKEAFYARHKKNLQGDSPRAKAFRVYAKKTWEEGGEIPVVPELYNGVIEVENNETVHLPNGTLAQFKGKDHEEGGIPTNLPGGSFIFSEHLKAPKELKEALGIKSKKKLSYADLSKKYPTKGLMEFLDESTDEFRRATKEIELGRNLANLNLIAETQEAMKTKFKNGGKYQDGGPRGIMRPDGSIEYLDDSFPTVYETESPLYNASIVNRFDPAFGQQMLKGIKSNPLLNLGKKKYSPLDYLTDDTKDSIPASQQKEFFKPSRFKGIDRTGLVESQDYREPGFSIEPREDIPIGFDNQLTRDYLYNGQRYDSEFSKQSPWIDGVKSKFNTAFDKTKEGVKTVAGKLKNVGIDSTLAGTIADIALVAANKLKVEGPTLYDTTKKPIFSQYKRIEPKESQKALSLAINSLNNSNLPEQVKQSKIADLTAKFLDVQGQVDSQEAQRYQQFQDQNLSKLQSYMDINVDERYKNLDQYTREKGNILRQENKFKTWKNQQINNSIRNYFDYVDMTNKSNQLFDRNYTVNPITGKVKFKEKPESQLSSLSEQFKSQFAGNTMDLGNGLRGTVIQDPTTGKTQMFQFVQQTDGSYKLEPLFKQ